MNNTKHSQLTTPNNQTDLSLFEADYLSTHQNYDELKKIYSTDPDADIDIIDQQLWDLIDCYEQENGHPLPNNVKSAMRGWKDNTQPTREIMMGANTTSTPREVNDFVGNNADYLAMLQEQATQNAPIGQYDFSKTGDYADANLFDNGRLESTRGPAAIAAMAKEIHQPVDGWEDLYQAVNNTYHVPTGSTTGAPELLQARPDARQLSVADVEGLVGERGNEMNRLQQLSVTICTVRDKNDGVVPYGKINIDDFVRAA